METNYGHYYSNKIFLMVLTMIKKTKITIKKMNLLRLGEFGVFESILNFNYKYLNLFSKYLICSL
jgi:hypothetical protein